MKKTFTAFITTLEKSLARLPLYGHGIVAFLAFALTRVTNIILDKSYAASQYPVPFYVGRLPLVAKSSKRILLTCLKEIPWVFTGELSLLIFRLLLLRLFQG